MAIWYALRAPSGSAERVEEGDYAAYLAAGYTQIGPPWIERPDHSELWELGPFYVIAHPDGRRYAVKWGIYLNYYQPLGFVALGGELGEALPSGGLLVFDNAPSSGLIPLIA